jgi:hypothetical protein
MSNERILDDFALTEAVVALDVEMKLVSQKRNDILIGKAFTAKSVVKKRNRRD